MANWTYQLHLEDVFHDDKLSLKDKTDTIVGRIKAESWYSAASYELEGVLEELNDAADCGDVEWWDQVWDAFYDVADTHRVWVTTR
jgi:hypothetical protein